MENRYVAIYTKWGCPIEQGGPREDWIKNGTLINKEVSGIHEAMEFFQSEIKEKGIYNVWNMQIYDKETKEYIKI